jgi:hypothetical protein
LDVTSLCPFPAGVLPWEAAPGQRSISVLVKGTFVLVPGEITVAPDQDPLCEERHWDNSALASLRWPGDFAPVKRKVDVMLVGHAYAPRGEPVTSLVSRLTVGALTKSVRVIGDRVWTLNKASQPDVGAPAPFIRMPLRYERAALSADNPVGVDPHAPAVLAVPARPNLEPLDGGATACFGPIAPTWRARRKLLDEAATFWAYGIARDPESGAPPLGPAPPKFDFTFFNAAPPDQQIDMLTPGTPIELENLDPDHPVLQTRLAPMKPQVFRVPAPGEKGRVEEIILRCDALWIDTDRGVCVLTWRGVAEVGDGRGRLVVVADPAGKKLRWERVEKLLLESTAPTLRLPTPSAEGELAPDPLAKRHYDMKTPEPTSVSNPSTEPLPEPESGVQDAPTNPLETMPTPPRVERTRKRPSPKQPALPIVPVRGGDTVNLGGPPVIPAPPVDTEAPRAEPPKGIRPLMVMGAPLGKPLPPTAIVPSPEPAKAKVPEPPRPGHVGAASGPKPPRADARDPARTLGPALRKDLTIQRYAEISAALAGKGADRAAVLRAHLLTEPAWAMVEQHWKKAMARESDQNDKTLSDAFDEAYVAAQERLRRPIGVVEYARLQVGVERGEVGRVLADLELELGDLMRLQRVWTKRLAGSPDLAAELARAIAEARKVSP